MQHTIRPRRSVLYMPGSHSRALEKAKTLAADGLIFDLEDAVAPGAKQEARSLACAAAAGGGYADREIIIRVNGLTTPWGRDDVMQAASSGAHAILLPKVEDAGHIHEALSLMDRAGAPQSMAIWCMMETPLGILRAQGIASADPRIGALVMGTSDLTKDLGARHTPNRVAMLTSLGTCLLAARAAGVSIVDGVFLDLDDENGLEAACIQSRDMGFDGKTLIHPRQIEPANRVFGPATEDVTWAQRIIDAHTEASARGEGVVVVDGQLIENLHVVEARRTLALADAIARATAGS